MEATTPVIPSPRAAGAALLLSAAAMACGSGAPEPPAQLLDSRVREPAIQVDGHRSDWEGHLTRVGGRDVFAGFHREGDELYVALVSQDRGFDARVFRSGLTVWFDTAATRRRDFGVRFPVFDAAARKRLRADTAGGSPDRRRLLEAAGPGLILVRDGGRETRLSPGSAGGIEVAAAIDRGLFTWEARVPLDGGASQGRGLALGGADTISVGLQAGGDQGELVRTPPDSASPADSVAAALGDSARAQEGERRARRPPARRGGPGLGEVPVLELWTRVNLAGGGASAGGGGPAGFAPRSDRGPSLRVNGRSHR